VDHNNQKPDQHGQSSVDARQQQGINEDQQLQQEGNNEENQSIGKKLPSSNIDPTKTAAEPLETDASWEKPDIDDDNDIDPEDIEPENDDDISLPLSREKKDHNKRDSQDANPNNPANPNLY